MCRRGYGVCFPVNTVVLDPYIVTGPARQAVRR